MSLKIPECYDCGEGIPLFPHMDEGSEKFKENYKELFRRDYRLMINSWAPSLHNHLREYPSLNNELIGTKFSTAEFIVRLGHYIIHRRSDNVEKLIPLTSQKRYYYVEDGLNLDKLRELYSRIMQPFAQEIFSGVTEGELLDIDGRSIALEVQARDLVYLKKVIFDLHKTIKLKAATLLIGKTAKVVAIKIRIQKNIADSIDLFKNLQINQMIAGYAIDVDQALTQAKGLPAMDWICHSKMFE